MADLTITITIPDANRAEFLDAMCTGYGWTAESGVTRVAFTRQHFRDYALGHLRRYRREQAEKVALAAIVDAPDPDITA
jgi:hypothetical protein